MREAVGGSLLLYLIIPIIILFICFIGFIMNYASAYRSANYMVTQIENCQGRINNCGDIKKVHDLFTQIKDKYSYVIPNKITENDLKPCYFKNGNSYVFRVYLPVSFDLPIIGTFNALYVKAETKSITKVPDDALALFSKTCLH